MKAYILSIIGTSLIAAVIILFTPEGKSGGIEKHIKLLTSLALLIAIINPFLTFLKTLSGIEPDTLKDQILDSAESTDDPYEKIFYENLSEITADKLENKLKDMISEKFGIKVENLNVNAEYLLENGVVCFKRITVILSGGAILKNPYSIESYVKEITGVECKCLI